jgi:hypothetical protein
VKGVDIEKVGGEQYPVPNKTIYTNSGYNNNSNSFKIKIGAMNNGMRKSTGYVAKR